MRQANKAQANCRHSIERLNALMNPSPSVLKQTNIAHGHQQVNNGVCENAKIELQKDSSEPVEALDKIDRAMVSGREVKGGTERQDARPVDASGSARTKGH
jgi:hypothetical protein